VYVSIIAKGEINRLSGKIDFKAGFASANALNASPVETAE
jgi:hypothetical protein